MNRDTLPDPPAPPLNQSSLFRERDRSLKGYQEPLLSSGNLKPTWQPLVDALDQTQPDILKARQERATRMRHDDGATFNPFDDPNGKATSWALEMIPLPIAAEEWAVIENGLCQRAALLGKILEDVYGAQNLLKQRVLPAELIFSNPNFLHQCQGIQPTDNKWLSYYAADIYRDPSGQFRVLRDYGSNPVGLGYALENRIVISRVFSELFHATQTRRLASFFYAFHQNLVNRAQLQRETPNIVLLSPGPNSHNYFEHALLSRYLGYPLIEPQDLTVRNGKVFLKKLAGLEPVDTIIRHLEDDSIDPFALRKKTASGVAGMIQAAREQTIDLVNPIGCGFIDTPILAKFLPTVCRHVMDEDLLLASHPKLWCGDARERKQIEQNLDNYSILPAFDRQMSSVSAEHPLQAIQNHPHNFLAREPVHPSVVPAWSGHNISERFTILRIFGCATEQGFSIMPGGLAITAPNVEALTNDCPELQESKDIWVISDTPVKPFSLIESLQSSPVFNRGSDLPSRVADNLLWLGRYLERAEGLTRLLRATMQRLSSEASVDDLPEMSLLLKLLRAKNVIPITPEEIKVSTSHYLNLQLNPILFDRDTPDGINATLLRVVSAARKVRDRLSIDCFLVINNLEESTQTRADDPLDYLNEILLNLSSFSGLAMESMTRGLGWRFMDMGRRIERAMNQASLIRTTLPDICKAARHGLEALLEIADSIMTYRSRYRTTFQLGPVLDLLLLDESNPKSLAFQLAQLATHVEQLPRTSERRYSNAEDKLALEMLTSVRLLDLSNLDCITEIIEENPLSTFLTAIENNIAQFTQHISAHYLSRVPTTPHFTTILGESEHEIPYQP